MTDRFASDNIIAHNLIDQVEIDVNHISADGAYDDNFIYEKFSFCLLLQNKLFLGIWHVCQHF